MSVTATQAKDQLSALLAWIHRFLWGVGGRVHQKGLLGWESVDV
jgi:hypothetical protein